MTCALVAFAMLALCAAQCSYPRNIVPTWGKTASFIPDAALYRSTTNKAYFFSGTKYIRYTFGSGVDAGYDPPKSIAAEWTGWPSSWTSVDAAIQWNDTTAFFFRGTQFLAYANGAVLSGHPKALS